MSNHHTDELTRALRERSEEMTGTHVAFEDVKGRARGIRRRRRRRAMTGVAAAAVLLAVGAPIGLTLDGLDRNSAPPPAGRPTTTTEPTGQAEPQGPVAIDAAKARRGEDPAILFQTGTTLHRPGGADVELPKAYTMVAPFGEGWVGLDLTDGTTTVLGADGKPVQEPWPGASAAISSDGRSLATVVYGGPGNVDLQLWPTEDANFDDGYGSHVVAFDGDLQYAGFVAPETVAYNLTVFGDKGATQKPYVADWFSDEEPRELTSLVDVRGANDVTGVVSGMSKIDDLKGEYCAAVVKAASDKVAWETCDYRLERFSPDGRYLLAVDPQSDGLGSQGVTMLDAENGDVVAEFTVSGQAYMQTAVWESKSTALVPVKQGGTWYLLRLRPDGTVEKALEPSRAGGDSSPWQLQVTP